MDEFLLCFIKPFIKVHFKPDPGATEWGRQDNERILCSECLIIVVTRLHPDVSAPEKSSGVLEEPISNRRHIASLSLTKSSECDSGVRKSVCVSAYPAAGSFTSWLAF